MTTRKIGIDEKKEKKTRVYLRFKLDENKTKRIETESEKDNIKIYPPKKKLLGFYFEANVFIFSLELRSETNKRIRKKGNHSLSTCGFLFHRLLFYFFFLVKT